MADSKISALASGAPAQAGDEYVVARSGANYKLTGTDLLGLVTGTANTFSAAQTFSNPASFADGSASAPAVTNTGDTDTGIYYPAANEVAVTTGGTVAAGFNSNGLFFRNRIINGDMRIDQRNAGASVSISGLVNTYTLDRWLIRNDTEAVVSVQQSSTAPSGFVNSLLYTVTTADASIGATQQHAISQRVEGLNMADFGWGSASALTVTLSFWVRSSVTGTFGGAITNSAANRSYPFTYSISSASTWEYKSITIPGDTTGTWLTTNGIGAYIYWSTGTGSTYSGAAGAWAASDFRSATGAVNLVSTLSATFYLTGVQLETGSVATPFERRPYGTELQLCQRYYYNQSAANNSYTRFGNGITTTTSQAQVGVKMPVTMRTAPTLSTSGTASHYNVYTGSSFACTSVPVIDQAHPDFVVVQFNTAASMTINAANFGAANNSTSAFLGFSAEM